MKISHVAFGAAFGLISAAAGAQSATENMIRLYSDPNEFYLFDDTSVEMLHYQSERDIRICAETRRHGVPLEVEYDGDTAIVSPGQCFEFEAMRVAIRPAEELGARLDLAGTIETRAAR